jgi:ketol-acid reductoisomerase
MLIPSPSRQNPVTVYRAADVPTDALAGETVAVLGYGNLGRTAALNPRDSGVKGSDRQSRGRLRRACAIR